MKTFIKIGNYLFNPLLMPFFGALIFFLTSPRFIPSSIVEAKLFAIVILTIFIPLLFLFLLKSLRIITSLHLNLPRERRLPLLGFALLLLTINNFIIQHNLPELYYFFTALLMSILTALILSLFNLKISLHMIGLAAVLGFVLGISWLYKLQILGLIIVLIFGIGWAASARIQKSNYSWSTLSLGFLAGILPQLLFLLVALMHYRI